MTPFCNGRYKVLVVDDDPSVLSTYDRLLCRGGYRCVSVDDPRRVLDDEACYRDADAVLLDYKMPVMDGLSLLAELRRREVRAPAILISAFLNDEIRQQARNLGVVHILDKPIDVRSLRRSLADLLPIVGSAPTEGAAVAEPASDEARIPARAR